MGKMIDIILVHPEVHEFMHMMFGQREADFDRVRVIEIRKDADAGFGIYPCESQTVVCSSENDGQMYNEGISAAEAEWVMFCDGRDCFSSVYSLWALLHVMPIENVDILWADGYREEMLSQKPGHINQTKEYFDNVYGKLYRRKFLMDNGLRFHEEDGCMAGYALNIVAIACTQPHRILQIKSPIAPYTNTFRKEGIFSENILGDMVLAGMHTVTRILQMKRKAETHSVKIMYYAYIAYGTRPSVMMTDKEFDIFMKDARKRWEGTSETEREVIFQEAYDDYLNAYQILFNVYGKECVPPDPSFQAADRWIQNYYDGIPTEDHPKNKRRVAVYSGTRNVYPDIITSMKSLLYHTRMDAVYVLAEDDDLGEELPDCVKVINVTEQKFFPHDGPNYETIWSYMILLRAAYPMMFVKEDVILSLDVDTIIQEDISDLFDTDLYGYYFAGVHEITRDQEDYCNFGVILMNLAKLRDGMCGKIMDSLNKDKWDYPEQTAINTLCHGNILLLQNRYNVTPQSRLTGKADRESIIHYAGLRYWKCFAPVVKYASMSWDEVMNHE